MTNAMPPKGTALILGGSGKIGSNAAKAFAAAGWQVTPYTRGTDMSAAAMGCEIIVNGLNPPNYHNWAEIVPAITAQVIAAGRASGATIIVPANVYNIGAAPGVWSEATPHRPVARKGHIREAAERAYRHSGVQVINLRAGNFIDPERGDDVMSFALLNTVARGKITAPGRPDAMQTYCYLPDWARAAEMLAAKRAELPQWSDIPFAGHAFTANGLKAQVAAMTGRPLRMASFPWWLFTLTAPFWELAREMKEMRYLYDTDHRLDGARLAELLPDFTATPLEEVLRHGLQAKGVSTAQIHPDEAMRAGGQTVAAQ